MGRLLWTNSFFPLSKQGKGEGDKGSEGDESRRGKGAIGEG